MAVDHYENFPVASLLLPRRLRAPVRNIYRYARSADDIADEGDAEAEERLELLAGYRAALRDIAGQALSLPDGDPRKPVFAPLAETIRQYELPLEPFFDLLSAFEQDVGTTRYDDDGQLRDYCRRSANPVGRIMLHLYGKSGQANLAGSDAICTGLQLTNFWQDVALDWKKNRVYLPQDALRRHKVDEAFIADYTGLAGRMPPDAGGRAYAGDPRTSSWQALMNDQVEQARHLLRSGLPLTRRLPGRIGFELKLVVQGGLRILERMEQLHYDIFFHRPTLEKRDWILLLWRALG
ncbi:squalene synthase HpnC [Pollutimonas sp. M17]|uniref:squalene synthase HpnC n=1 Tax=Pollutimonas sp. M17 TaxID=2962065 RepID=UPI0021F3CF6C|nr:squalene synthase HpnC [Pollutimonas sp. M17]UYO92598.1 squalene synthase HpnC [Pollutimonas sp. M17]